MTHKMTRAQENALIEARVQRLMDRAGTKGIRVDDSRLTTERLGLQSRLATATQDMAHLNFTGRPSSRKEVAEYLFDEQGLPETPNRSVAKEHLQHLDHPFIAPYQEWSTVKRTLSLLDSMAKFTNEGRVTSEWQCSNETSGRIYCRDFNVQQLPLIGRRALVPDRGLVFTLLDYDQNELRMLAALSQDQNLTNALESGDVHRATAALMLGKRPEEVTADERERGKALNYGPIYGQEDSGLAMRLGVSKQRARELLDTYFDQYPDVAAFLARTKAAAARTGRVTNPWGHERTSFSPDPEKAGREAVNTLIQGSAASGLKRALIRLDSYAEVVATVHDSALVQHRGLDEQELLRLFEYELNGVRFTAKLATANSWGECMEQLKGSTPPEE